jgi:hypothetical protein
LPRVFPVRRRRKPGAREKKRKGERKKGKKRGKRGEKGKEKEKKKRKEKKRKGKLHASAEPGDAVTAGEELPQCGGTGVPANILTEFDATARTQTLPSRA